MHADLRRARSLAVLLDFLMPAAAADALGLLATGAAWFLGLSSPRLAAWFWAVLAAGAASAFLLRDARGGRARRWLGLEVVRSAAGGPPGAWGSIRRNLPLLVPIWNLIEVWPVLSDGAGPRRSDRSHGLAVVRTE
jgi:hypothetical protein